MAEESILTDDFLRELMNVGEVDILVGMPTYNDAATVGQVVQAVRAGLIKYFPRQRAVIINADGGSKDATPELVRAASISDLRQPSGLTALRTLHSISTQYPHGGENGQALRLLLAAADLLRAGACVVVSADSVNIEAEWLDRLLRPITNGSADLVTPLYHRHRFDGLLVRNLLYPMIRAMYGKRVREPYPSEFAFSGRLGSYLLGQDIWSEDGGNSGAEICITISALAGNFQVAESFLGSRGRIEHGPADLVHAMRQTVGVSFWLLDPTFPAWSATTGSQPVPSSGGGPQVTLEPLRINRKRLHQMFQVGVAELEPVLKSILAPPTLAELQKEAAAPQETFRYPDDLWVRTVYEFAASYHKSVISRDHIIQALAPLYRGRAYTFLVENIDATGEQTENKVEDLCLTFERLKPYLLEMWDGRK
ncbi:MAG: glycosyltransferase [Acidobacteriales bacterium]|nr:glycosyltransferase [Terriglobales bacterium]